MIHPSANFPISEKNSRSFSQDSIEEKSDLERGGGGWVREIARAGKKLTIYSQHNLSLLIFYPPWRLILKRTMGKSPPTWKVERTS